MFPRRAVGLLAALLAASQPAPAADPGVRNFFNVVAPDGADPWVVRHTDGMYYATMTTGDNVTLWRSATLTGIGSGEQKVIWRPPAKGPNSKEIWAPELHRLRGKWYIYYAADDGENANHRMYVLENGSDDPFQAAFADKGKIADPAADRWAIDGTAFEFGGRLYFLWSGWEGTENVQQILYIAPMENPWTLAGPRVEISRPTHPWEKRGEPPSINEGPQVLVKDGTVHVVYSAAGSWTDHYCLGLLTAKAGSDLLNPASWRKHPEPVFQTGNGVIAPGHCSFTKSPDGKEDWIVYHTARFPGAGWDRLVRAQPFTWNGDGTPRFGEPADPNAPIPLPGGEPPRRRYEAEAGNANSVREATASTGAAVRVGDRANGPVEVAVRAERNGTYNLTVRFSNRSADKRPAVVTVSAGNAAPRPVQCEYTGEGNWSNAAVRVVLKAGPTAIRFVPRRGTVLLDSIDVSAAGLKPE